MNVINIFTENLRRKLLPGEKKQSELTNLDGLRGLACTFVIASHTLFATESTGATGVWIFFSLSGFLLYRSLSPNFYEWKLNFIAAFLVRRILRIVPLYWIAVFVYGLLWKANDQFLIDHWLFLDAKTFFWTVKTELYFYLLLPIIGLILTTLRGEVLKAVCLLFAAVLYHLYIELAYGFLITAAVTEIPLFLSPFLLGMAGSAISKKVPERYARMMSFFMLFIIIVFCVGFSPSLPIRKFFFGDIAAYNIGWLAIGFTSAICAVFVVACARARPDLVLSNPILRSFGLFGYSVYLWHILVFTIIKQQFPLLDNWIYFVVTLLITYPVAALSFMAVERPLINIGRKITFSSNFRLNGI